MAVREKRREKKEKADETPPETETAVTREVEVTLRPEVTESTSETTAPEKTSIIVAETDQMQAASEETETLLLPPWGTVEESEWMYSIPSRDEDRQLWAAEWSDFILKWMESRNLHILSITVFVSETPFKDLLGKTDALRTIGETLVDQEIAEWMDNKHRQLRVYWRPLEDWADIIYEWSIRTGNTLLDVKTLVIQERSQQFSTLPERDLRIIFGIMVTRRQAEWVDPKIGAIRLILAP